MNRLWQNVSRLTSRLLNYLGCCGTWSEYLDEGPYELIPGTSKSSASTSNHPGKITLAIDLDETLVHSTFIPNPNADFIIPVEVDGRICEVYVTKRPYVDEFLKRVGELYECILFTASLPIYADPIADLLDKLGIFTSRMYRDACVIRKGNYVKDLNKLEKDLNRVVILDNNSKSYIFHPDNAVHVNTWYDDQSDTELLKLIPFLERLASVENVYTVLATKKRTISETEFNWYGSL